MIKYSFATLVLSLSFLSCSHDDGGSSTSVAQEKTYAALRAEAISDRDAIVSSGRAFYQLNPSMQNSLTSFFGGGDGYSIQKYLDERIHFYISEDEWTDLQTEIFGKSQSSDSAPDDPTAAHAVTAGVNVGTSLFLEGALLGEQNLTFKFRGQNINRATPRVGLMLIGDGYDEQTTLQDGSIYEMPLSFRQSILIHEARHSDCPNGLSKSDMNAIRTKSKTELSDSFATLTCGHMHSLCPASHQYHGLYACDKMPWGAYTAGAMFEVLESKSQATDLDRRVMEFKAADSLSRLLFDIGDMLSGKLGAPNMGSLGVVD